MQVRAEILTVALDDRILSTLLETPMPDGLSVARLLNVKENGGRFDAGVVSRLLVRATHAVIRYAAYVKIENGTLHVSWQITGERAVGLFKCWCSTYAASADQVKGEDELFLERCFFCTNSLSVKDIMQRMFDYAIASNVLVSETTHTTADLMQD